MNGAMIGIRAVKPGKNGEINSFIVIFIDFFSSLKSKEYSIGVPFTQRFDLLIALAFIIYQTTSKFMCKLHEWWLWEEDIYHLTTKTNECKAKKISSKNDECPKYILFRKRIWIISFIFIRSTIVWYWNSTSIW